MTKPMKRIYDYESFKTEFSKKIDLSQYSTKVSGEEIYYYELNHNDDIYLKENPKNFQIKLNGKTITMPAKVSEIIDAGYNITEIDHRPVSDVDMNRKYSFTTVTFENETGKSISCYLYGTVGKKSAPLKDCLITQVTTDINNPSSSTSLSEEMQLFIDGKYADSKYFGSIGLDSSLNDILNTLGAPKTIWYTDSQNSDYLALSYEFKDSEGRSGSIQITMHTTSPYEDVEFTEFSQSLSYRIEIDT